LSGPKLRTLVEATAAYLDIRAGYDRKPGAPDIPKVIGNSRDTGIQEAESRVLTWAMPD